MALAPEKVPEDRREEIVVPGIEADLGRAVRTNSVALWTGGLVFLAFWLPMCSGLRSEGIIVLGTLATWWAVEVTVSTRRMLPAVIAAFTAALTLALAPHGLVALALLIASARPMLRILVRRRAEDGLLPLLAPLLAGVALVVIIVFRDQPLPKTNVGKVLRRELRD